MKKIISLITVIAITISCFVCSVSAATTTSTIKPVVGRPLMRFEMGLDGCTTAFIKNESFATIRYTTDGTKPTSSSTKWTGEDIELVSNKNNSITKMTLKLLISKKGYTSRICTYYVPVRKGNPTSTVFKLSVSEMRTTVNNIVMPYIEKAKAQKTEYDKVKVLWDAPIYSSYRETPFFTLSCDDKSSFKEGMYEIMFAGGVCAESSTQWASICTLAGVNCLMVCGTTDMGYHAWNYVEIDGKWYSCDHTFNSFCVSTDHSADDKSLYNDPTSGDAQLRASQKELYKSLGNKLPELSIMYESSIDRMIATSTTDGSENYAASHFTIAQGTSINMKYFMPSPEKAEFYSVDETKAKVVKKSDGNYYLVGVGDGQTKIGVKIGTKTYFLSVDSAPVKKSTKFELDKTSVTVKARTVAGAGARQKGTEADVMCTLDECIYIVNDLNFKGVNNDGKSKYQFVNDSVEFVNFVCTNTSIASANITRTQGSAKLRIVGNSEGTTTIYVITSTGQVKEITVTVKGKASW